MTWRLLFVCALPHLVWGGGGADKGGLGHAILVLVQPHSTLICVAEMLSMLEK
jgi:hypothetical protein